MSDCLLKSIYFVPQLFLVDAGALLVFFLIMVFGAPSAITPVTELLLFLIALYFAAWASLRGLEGVLKGWTRAGCPPKDFWLPLALYHASVALLVYVLG